MTISYDNGNVLTLLLIGVCTGLAFFEHIWRMVVERISYYPHVFERLDLLNFIRAMQMILFQLSESNGKHTSLPGKSEGKKPYEM